MAFSPDGRWLATGSDDKTARLWDLKADDPAKPPPASSRGHEGSVTALAFSPDGRWLATGSDDKTARLWDLKADDPETTARVLNGPRGLVLALAFSPDGRWLATASKDATARLWPITVEELLKQAERAVGRNFTYMEWIDLFGEEKYRKTFERLPSGWL